MDSLETIRLKLADMEELPLISLLGTLAGVLAGLIILLFRLLIDFCQALFLPSAIPGNFEGLEWWWRLLLPAAGGAVLGLIWHKAAPAHRAVGITHVMERLAYHHGNMPLPNLLYQFFGAAFSIICGHSVGREGPGVHLGAAVAGLFGQWLQLPNNSIRILLACGCAAAIGALFNTPLAGVVFAMEVVLTGYSILEFTPVILAAVAGTLICRVEYADKVIFSIPEIKHVTLSWPELFYLLPFAGFIGLAAKVFIHSLEMLARQSQPYPVWQSMALAGFLTGLIAVFVPQVMGMGYDTVNQILGGSLGITLLLVLIGAKFVASVICVGLGLPGGLIGPLVVIGTALGACAGLLAHSLFPDTVTSPVLYAILGMAGMMGAVLQAPLAALIAALEMSGTLSSVLPGMISIIVANLVASSAPLGKKSVFIHLMRVRGLDYRSNPAAVMLSKVGVMRAMQREVAVLTDKLSAAQARQSLQNQPKWIIVQDPKQHRIIFPAADLAHYIQDLPEDGEVNLNIIPAHRQELLPLSFQASAREALELLESGSATVLYIVRHDAAWPLGRVYGIVTRNDLAQYYKI